MAKTCGMTGRIPNEMAKTCGIRLAAVVGRSFRNANQVVLLGKLIRVPQHSPSYARHGDQRWQHEHRPSSQSM